VNTKESLVLKQLRSDPRAEFNFSYFGPLEREACALVALQRFEWSARLLCVAPDYLLTSYKGKLRCKDELPADYSEQVRGIIADMTSVGIRHNDMIKPGNDFVVDASGRVSLVDFGWATLHGQVGMSCQFRGVHISAPDRRPHNIKIDRGFAHANEAEHSLVPCNKSRSDKKSSPPSLGEQKRTGTGPRATIAELLLSLGSFLGLAGER
jgi:hypothetical protein